MDRNEAITAIKTALENRSGKKWSVTGGRGTAWGWITITVPPKRLGCAHLHEYVFNRATGDDDCANCGMSRFDRERPQHCTGHICGQHECTRGYITPEDAKQLAELLSLDTIHMQGESIPASNGHYREYVARAGGLQPTVCGKQYWD